MNNIQTICYFGDFNPEYARNRVLIRGLQENNVKVIFCQTTLKGYKKYLDLIKKHKQIKNSYDLLLVGYSDSRCFVPFAKIISNKKIIWDAFYSLYDSWIFDKKLAKTKSFKAIYYWFLDWFSCVIANKILLDTNSHIEYFVKIFKIKKSKFIRVLVGTDETIFKSMPKVERDNKFTIHFHGKFIPLQGVKYIIKAAKLLENYQDIKFNIIGRGQTYNETFLLAGKLQIKNINFIKGISYNMLPEYMQQADICLGIFGDTNKTKRVIPNKVYEAAAMAKPIVSGETMAMKELFTNKENILFCNVADSNDLAKKILELKNNKNLMESINKNSFKLFKEKFLPKILVKDLLISLNQE